jgi:hypothetical protein
MKWGVRRFQKKDGTLTPKGKKRYDDTSTGVKQKSKHQLHLEQKYRKAGLSKQEAEIQANKRIKTEKIVTAAAGITIAAATAYVVHKKLKEKADGIIKAGTSLQRVEMQGNGQLYDTFYAAHDKHDKTKYAGMLGFTRRTQTGKSYLMDIGVTGDIKVAGKDKAFGVFKNLYDNDPDFRNAASSLVDKNVHGRNIANGNVKKMYENFNTNLIKRDNTAVKTFYSTLKSQGYGAVRDVNDMKFSGYNAKNPLIVFGSSDKVSVKSFSEMKPKDINKSLIKDGAREATKFITKSGGVLVTAKAASMYVEDYDKNEYNL